MDIQLELSTEDFSIIENVLSESYNKTMLNISLQDKKLKDTGIPSGVLKQIAKNKKRALDSLKKQIELNQIINEK